MSKKFKDTKLGTFLGNTAPHILDIAGRFASRCGGVRYGKEPH